MHTQWCLSRSSVSRSLRSVRTTDHDVPNIRYGPTWQRMRSPNLASGQSAQHSTPMRNILHSFQQQSFQQQIQAPSSVTSTQPCLLQLSTTLTTTATLVAGRARPLQVLIACNHAHRAPYLRPLQHLHSNSAVARSYPACLALSTLAVTRVLYGQRASHMVPPSAWDRLHCFIV